MDHLGTQFHTFFDWLLQTTLQASLLICLILLVQRALGRRLGVRGRYFLWLVLLVRMALPWAPQSRLSVYNLLPFSPPKGHRLSAAVEAGRFGSTSAVLTRTSGPAARGRAAVAPGDVRGIESEPSEGHWPGAGAIVFLSLLWLVGAGALAGHILAGSMRLWRIVRRAQRVSDARILDVLAECQRRIGTKTTVAVLATDEVSCPALFGFVRPRLLFPTDTMVELSLDELRHVFLHELAHLKRHDILVGAVASVLHVLHWFNPLVAFGFRRMRADRELACDGLAMSVLAPEETFAYGRTVVRQIEQLLALRPRPLLAALSGDRARIKQRIAMITGFRKEAYRWSPLTIALIAGLVCMALTNGRAVVRPPEPPALENEFTNIIRVYIRHNETGQYLVANDDAVTCDAAEPGDQGLWEARFDGSAGLGHGDDVLLYSVSNGTYLASDAEGNLAAARSVPDESACWIIRPSPLGVQIISKEFPWRYVRLEEDGQIRAIEWGRDLRSQWDVMQLGRVR